MSIERYIEDKMRKFLASVNIDFDEIYGKRFDVCITPGNRMHSFYGSKFRTVFIGEEAITSPGFISDLAHETGHLVNWLRDPRFSFVVRQVVFLSRYFKKSGRWYLRLNFSIPQLISMFDGTRLAEEVRADRIGMEILRRCGYDPSLILKKTIPEKEEFRDESLIQRVFLYYVTKVRRNRARFLLFI